MSDKPFFSDGLLVTAPDGTYGGLRRSQRFAAYDDRVEIDGVQVYYPYLTELRVYGNVLHVAYAASDGKQVEKFFRYNTFLARTGAKKLLEMAERVSAARKAVVTPSVWTRAAVVPQQPALRAELVARKSGGITRPSTRRWSPFPRFARPVGCRPKRSATCR